MKYREFLAVAALLNERLGVTPMLFGSVGLERRLGTDLGADDVDVLLPEHTLKNDWEKVSDLMAESGYSPSAGKARGFLKDGVMIEFGSIEGVAKFAGLDITAVPHELDGGADYLLLDLPMYLRVYRALAAEPGRENKRDRQKIALIERAVDGVS